MKKLLIANRGEIAVRIIRAAREMGIATVAVYSDADARAVHTLLADEAVGLGGSEPAQSYLDIAKVLDAARSTGADAIHPGYGFLSERAEFAEACAEAGVTFVGPPPSAMRRLGAKSDAKQLAVEQGVPIVPGMFETGATPQQLEAAAAEIGYPVMLKASAGGGGRGMRIVREPSEFAGQLAMASDEALKAFGDGTMMVEKLVERPRHVEVQVVADAHGNVAALFERECSLQRRHQKILEEAPSPAMTPDLWQRMRESAVRLVRAAGYVGAGTVEFMLDEAGEHYYFLEVNARLQVEHPVTELVTGVDLVQCQLRVARGETLGLPAALVDGDRAALSGWSMEARVVAEDPAAGFLPSIGPIVGWAEPRMPGVRVDTGYGKGSEVSRFYDSLLAKVIVHAPSRLEAIRRLELALEDFHVLGVKTNVGYLLDVIRHPDFRAGKMDTGFLGREFGEWQPPAPPEELGALVQHAAATETAGAGEPQASGVWSLSDGFRNARA
jgi:acetyl/propionyl-CoA carboxylase alpha subunit